MSVMNRSAVKVLLPRGPHEFWDIVRDLYPEDRETWGRLAMLALREDANWSVARIARAFGRTRAQVLACLDQIRNDLRTRLEQRHSCDDE